MKRWNAAAIAPTWVLTSLGQILTPSCDRRNPLELPDLPFIGMEHVEPHTMRLLGTVPAGTMRSRAVHFQPGAVMYGRLRPYLNKVLRADMEGLCSAEFIVFPPTPHLEPRYMQFFLSSSDFVSFASHLNTGDRPRVDFEQLAAFPVPLPPLAEQRRIVAEIEKQFTRLEAAEAALLRGRANLKRYRAACLQAVSVEGPTTMFGSLCRDASYGSSVKCDYAFDGPPVVRIPNIERGHLRLDDLKFAPGMATFNDRDALAPGDFLVIRTNGSRNLIGRAALVDHELDRRCYYASYLIRFRLALDPLRQRWLSVVWDAPRIRVQVERAAATSAGQYNLSIGALARVSVPIPPPERLAGILSEIEDRLSVVQKVADVIEANLQRAARLREAILKRAFEGKLVPQDPNDEPASVLLERIRRQRAERQNSAPLRQRRRRKDVS